MKLLLRTLIVAFLLSLGSPEIRAQDTKYSIDGPAKVPLSRRIVRWQDERRKKAEERHRRKQKRWEEKGRQDMIKRHLANQPPETRARLKKELEAEANNYPVVDNKRKLPKKKIKKLEL